MEPPHSWIQWSNQLQLGIIAKENLVIVALSDRRLNGPETQIPMLEQATKSELDIYRVSGETRNQKAMKVYEPTKEKWIDDEKKSFNE